MSIIHLSILSLALSWNFWYLVLNPKRFTKLWNIQLEFWCVIVSEKMPTHSKQLLLYNFCYECQTYLLQKQSNSDVMKSTFLTWGSLVEETWKRISTSGKLLAYPFTLKNCYGYICLSLVMQLLLQKSSMEHIVLVHTRETPTTQLIQLIWR